MVLLLNHVRIALDTSLLITTRKDVDGDEIVQTVYKVQITRHNNKYITSQELIILQK